jgi:hypothetical protein
MMSETKQMKAWWRPELKDVLPVPSPLSVRPISLRPMCISPNPRIKALNSVNWRHT